MGLLYDIVVTLQIAAPFAVVTARSRTAAALCLFSIPLTWFVAVELVSMHIASAVHLLWLLPMTWIVWALLARRRAGVSALPESADGS